MSLLSTQSITARLRDVETSLREALQEKELLERKLARLTANRETDVTTLQASEVSASLTYSSSEKLGLKR